MNMKMIPSIVGRNVAKINKQKCKVEMARN
jgi:hypothetical protein